MSEDDFKWFGENFDGFPKKSLEDCVEYKIYIVKEELSENQIRERLSKVQSNATSLLKTLLKEFIWQRDGFSLELAREDGESFRSSLAKRADPLQVKACYEASPDLETLSTMNGS